MFRVALDNLRAASGGAAAQRLAILDGQFGDKLTSSYIQDGFRLLQSQNVQTLLICFTCSEATQRCRLLGRGAQRDQGKLADEGMLAKLREQWLNLQQEQIQKSELGVCTVSLEQPLGDAVEQVLQLLRATGGA